MNLDGILALEDRVYQIGEVAELFGMTTRSIRFYEEQGLVKPIRRGRGRRKYGRAEIERIDMIVSCRQVGMSMDTISRLVAIRDAGDEAVFRTALADALLERRTQMEEEIATLQGQRHRLVEWISGDPDERAPGQGGACGMRDDEDGCDNVRRIGEKR